MPLLSAAPSRRRVLSGAAALVGLAVAPGRRARAATRDPDPRDRAPPAALARTDRTTAELDSAAVDRIAVCDLETPSGRIVACDPLVGLYDYPALVPAVPVGRHPVFAYVDRDNEWGARVALAELRLSEAPVVEWRIALSDEAMRPEMTADMIWGYGVDAGMGCFCDAAAQDALRRFEEARAGTEPSYGETTFLDAALKVKTAAEHRFAFAPAMNVALFSSGYGDGYYASYWGLDAAGEPARLVTSFGVFEGDARPDASVDKGAKA